MTGLLQAADRMADHFRGRATADLRARFVPYDLGHAVFEFIEAKYGKAGIQSYMWMRIARIYGHSISAESANSATSAKQSAGFLPSQNASH